MTTAKMLARKGWTPYGLALIALICSLLLSRKPLKRFERTSG